MIFRTHNAMNIHQSVFCNDRFHYCELYGAIYKQYEEEYP